MHFLAILRYCNIHSIDICFCRWLTRKIAMKPRCTKISLFSRFIFHQLFYDLFVINKRINFCIHMLYSLVAYFKESKPLRAQTRSNLNLTGSIRCILFFTQNWPKCTFNFWNFKFVSRLGNFQKNRSIIIIKYIRNIFYMLGQKGSYKN